MDPELHDSPHPPWPVPDEDVREALAAAYGDGSWGQYHGVHTERLIAALAEYHGVPHVTLCCSGTIAVELALRGLKVGPHDEVVLAGYDFAGNFRAVESVGATPVLVDIDPRTWCLDAEQLVAANDHRTRAVIVSHLHGGLAAMERMVEVAHARGIAVVEDACQAPGARVGGRVAGTWGDVGVLSFGGSKLLTAGRGGAVLTRDVEVHQRIKTYASRGNDAFAMSQLQAAVLLPQLAKLDARNAIRGERARRIITALANGPRSTLQPVALPSPGDVACYYKIGFLLPEQLADRRDDLICAAQANGLPLDAGFRGFARRSSRRCRRVGELPFAQAAAERTLLLHHPVLLGSPAAADDLAARLANLAAL